MKQNKMPQLSFPEGCYGSASAILVFVGTSPGGNSSLPINTKRDPNGGLALWNESFTEPFDDSANGWGGKYKYSIPLLIETILGISIKDEGDKLYAFANFDWVKCSKEDNVSKVRMSAGEDIVVGLLTDCKARVIIPLTIRAKEILYSALQRHDYILKKIPNTNKIPIPGGKFHYGLDISIIENTGNLYKSIIIRCPQHPNRMLNKDHAKACALAIRSALDSIA